jgi:signal transduction histidine kinase
MIMEEPMSPLARILCVDDGPANLSLLEGLLSPLGYDVVMAANGQQALEKIKTEPIDLCLLDIIMPGMDGLEVCRRIKSDPATRNIPVVLLTALTESKHRILGAEAGAEDFISKPFNTTEVLARIKMLLHVKSINGQLQTAYQEITDLKNSLEERVARAIDEIRQKDQMLIALGRMAAIGEMIHNIAHQWNQPLNALGLIVQQLPFYHETGTLTGELLNENTQQAMMQIKHMSQTINDFRNLFKVDKEAIAFSVNEVITRTLSLLEKTFKDQIIHIAFQPEGHPRANGFPNEYSQVLLNILLNARDALVEHKVDHALISIRSFAEGRKSVVTITDNAGGITEEIIDKLFDAYFSTKGESGTGIGLFMSKAIIEKSMKGKLTVRNSGNGAEFRIEV